MAFKWEKIPVAIKAGIATIPPRTALPAAIPPPPAAKEPPPNQAKVAFVAAAPLKEAIAVPVEAAPYVEIKAHVPTAVPIPAEIPFPVFIAISAAEIVSSTS